MFKKFFIISLTCLIMMCLVSTSAMALTEAETTNEVYRIRYEVLEEAALCQSNGESFIEGEPIFIPFTDERYIIYANRADENGVVTLEQLFLKYEELLNPVWIENDFAEPHIETVKVICYWRNINTGAPTETTEEIRYRLFIQPQAINLNL